MKQEPEKFGSIGVYTKDTNKKIPLQSIDYNVDINNILVSSTLTLVFANDTKDILETQFIMPTESSRVISSLKIKLNDKEIVS
jgi:hypothetical protein